MTTEAKIAKDLGQPVEVTPKVVHLAAHCRRRQPPRLPKTWAKRKEIK